MEVTNIFSLGELFEEVQMKNIFPDGKTFVDCTPLEELTFIKKLYDSQKLLPGFDLKNFVHEHFSIPKNYSTVYKSVAGRPIENHIELLWDELTRQPETSKDSLITLPYPYIVPGGRFREIYYWDSYFTMLGLQVSGRIDMIRFMVNNFSYLIDKIGYVPNGNRTYYLGRSQPPFYASMVNLLCEQEEKNCLIKYLPQLEKEYNFWMNGRDELNIENPSSHRVVMLRDGNILNHYWDENDTPRPESYKEDAELAEHVTDKEKMYRHLRAAAESGWDFSTRWFKDAHEFSSIHTTEIIPIDLNCLLFNLEKTLAKAYDSANDKINLQKFKTLAGKRLSAINKYCWNDDKGFYFDYDHIESKLKESLTLAGAFPLFFGIASDEQAKKISQIIEKNFLMHSGLVSTIETTGQQWDAPNGWAPLQWIAIQGLAKYGFTQLAKNITDRWLAINEKVYHTTGKMMEKYNVVASNLEAGGGEYPAQDGFGWTNGVYLALKKWMGTT